jgi:hypothetical protein
MPGDRDGPEFSHLVDAARIGDAESVYRIAADTGERAALAQRFDLLGLDRLEAEVRLKRLGGGLFRLTAALSAAAVQACVVTAEPVASTVTEQFSLLYGAVEAEREIILDGEAEPIEPLIDGKIDIGEAVAQQLSLALDPFPRAPDADSPAAAAGNEPADDPMATPFGGLKAWGKRGSGEA